MVDITGISWDIRDITLELMRYNWNSWDIG
jgi:hypothetical protein